jgi:hypothetical protein
MASFADDFNRADSTTVGNGWVEVSGDWSIASNRLSPGAAGGTIILRCGTPMASADHAVQATIAVAAAVSAGIWARGNSNISNGYLWRNDGTSWNLFSVVGGSFTSIGSFAGAAVAGDVAKLECIGSAIKGYVNGIVRVSVTNTDVAAGVETGFRSESAGGVRYDDFSAADITTGSDVTGTITGDFGGLGGGITATREVTGAVARSGGALEGGITGVREAVGVVAHDFGGLGGGATAVREVSGGVVFAGGALGGGVTASSDDLMHADTSLVTKAWLATISALAGVQIASTLPAVEKWVAKGAITVGPTFPGIPELYAPLRHPIVQIDCWAVFTPNSKKLNHGLANHLAEVVLNASYEWDVPAITMPPGIRPVHLGQVYPVSEIRWVPDPDTNFAHYAVDLHVGWVEQGAMTGVNG